MKITTWGLENQDERIKSEIYDVLKEVSESGSYVLGKNVKKFEEDFSRYCGGDYGVGVNSGTDALMLALKAVGVGEGDEVITAPNSFIATGSTAVLCGAKPIFADIDPETYNLDPKKVEKVLRNNEKKVKAIVPVHLYGHPADMDPLCELAEKYGLFIVEDAAQAHGAVYKGRKTGSLGNIGCFSFYPTKNLGGIGDGGMLVVNDEKLAQNIRLFRDYGRDSRYTHTIIGYNSRLDEIQAAVLRVKLKYLDGWIEKRRKNARIYGELLSDVRNVELPVEKAYARQAPWVYVIRTEQRDKLQNALQRKGVETAVTYPVPIHLQKAFGYLGLKEGTYPITEKYSREILALPVHQGLDEQQIQHIARTIKENV
jgi:dTDP-4-amino-4,6-dideoxygalactose transaminase